MVRGLTSGNPAMQGLGSIVGILLGLYAFDQILDAIWATINVSTFFASAVAFAQTILPVVGLIGIFYTVWRTLQKMGLV